MICENCNQDKPICAKGLCRNCYQKRYLKKRQEKNLCTSCGKHPINRKRSNWLCGFCLKDEAKKRSFKRLKEGLGIS
jgi:hypothetical protein